MPTIKTASTKLNSDVIHGLTTTATRVLTGNRSRRSLSIQNIGTTKVFIRFGAAPVLSGTKAYSFILTPASGADEGDGGILSVDNYPGEVWAVTASSTSTAIVTDFVG